MIDSRLERLVNRHPHGTAHRRHGFLDSEHEAEAKFNEGMRGDDTAVEEPSIHLLNMPVTTPSNRHERELRTADLPRYNRNNTDELIQEGRARGGVQGYNQVGTGPVAARTGP